MGATEYLSARAEAWRVGTRSATSLLPLGCPCGSGVEYPPAMQGPQETRVPFLGQEDPLEEEMATPFSILAWKTPWTEEPGRLQS